MQVGGLCLQEVPERRIRGDQVRRGAGAGAQAGQRVPLLQPQPQARPPAQGRILTFVKAKEKSECFLSPNLPDHKPADLNLLFQFQNVCSTGYLHIQSSEYRQLHLDFVDNTKNRIKNRLSLLCFLLFF